MRCNFVVGQRVVCIKGPWFDTAGKPSDGPKPGEVCEITRVWPFEQYVYLGIRGWSFDKARFRSDNFRPLQERKTDISIFQALLNPVKQREDA